MEGYTTVPSSRRRGVKPLPSSIVSRKSSGSVPSGFDDEWHWEARPGKTHSRRVDSESFVHITDAEHELDPTYAIHVSGRPETTR